LLQRLLGLIKASHPLPLTLVVSLTVLIGLVSNDDDGDVNVRRLAFVAAAMLFSQLAIGWTNDYVDRDRDRAFQPSKPVASGLVPVGWLPPLSVVAIVASFAAGAALGLSPLAFLAGGTAAGLAYDFWFKDTRLSWLPYVVAFALLPPFVWSALDVYDGDYWSLYVVGLPLAIAAHLANTIPDIEADAASGRHNLAVLLGRTYAGRAIGACFLLVFLLLLPGILVSEQDQRLVTTGRVGLVAFGLIAAGVAYDRETRAGDVWGFRFVAAAGIVVATTWLASI
jgi:4-hydroxybenzoate polyprenyltransferase